MFVLRFLRWFLFMAADGDGGGTGGSGGAAAGGDGGGAGGGAVGAAAGDGGASAAGAGGDKGAVGGDGKGAAAGGDGKSGAAAGGAAAGAAGGNGKAAEGVWPSDWRQQMAGGDAKRLKQLERYASPQDVWNKAVALEGRLTAGELKPTLPKNASSEVLAEYRKAHGIPETAAGYSDHLKDLKLDDADKPLVDQVVAAAHAVHASPEAVKAMVGVWPKLKEAAAHRQHELDSQAQQVGEDTLRGEWGGEFRRNMSLVHQLLDGTGDKTLKDQVLGGRLADGTPIGSSPAALKMLLGVALQANPTGLVLPGGNADPSGSIREELKKIDDVRRKDRKSYDKDTAMQERERELIGAAQRMGMMDDSGNWKKAA